jgi:primase-polymerase (primpol)-like protein
MDLIESLYDHVPALLYDRPNWVLWRWEEIPGRGRTKVPYRPSGERAKANDSTTWRPFHLIVRAYKRGLWDGVGFVVSDEDDLCGVDLDHCRDPQTGEIAEWTQTIIDALDSYTEVSPSQTGIRIWIIACKPGLRCVRTGANRIEIYERDRMFTVTGEHVPGTPRGIEHRQANLATLYHELFPPQPKREQTQRATDPVELDDQELVRRMLASRDAKLVRLWNGSLTDYNGNHSSADLALCIRLCFWTHGDPGRIDELFRCSGLMRDKWDAVHYGNRETYGTHTTSVAIGMWDGVGYEPHDDEDDGEQEQAQSRALNPPRERGSVDLNRERLEPAVSVPSWREGLA